MRPFKGVEMRTVVPQQPVEFAERQLGDAGRRLGISVIDIPLQESTPSEYRRVFSEIARDRPDAIIVSSDGALFPYRQ